MTSPVQAFCGKWMLAFCWLLAGCVTMVGGPAAWAQPPSAKLPGVTGRLAGVKSWGYQLQRVDPAQVAASPYDLVVIDYSRNGADARRFTPDEVQQMQTRPDGSRRLVIAYLSIGEAEDHRFYWSRAWVEAAPLRERLDGGEAAPLPQGVETVRVPKLIAPPWLGRENEHWPGNYQVRFWHPGWQDVILDSGDSYLARIVSAGFDGVYLDRVDAYRRVERDTESAREWMIGFVSELATQARQRKPDFIVIPQNAEELLRDARYLSAIDGVAKEDLLFGGDGDAERNSGSSIQQALRQLAAARAMGLPVLAVEYLSDATQIERADAELRSRGMVPYFGPRALDRLVVPAANDAAALAAEKPDKAGR
jgi:cysteinyl-tRNA synthetase